MLYFELDENDHLISFDEQDFIVVAGHRIQECDHLPDYTLSKPKWDKISQEWVEGITEQELSDMQAKQQFEQDNAPENVNAKLDLILELLQKKEE